MGSFLPICIHLLFLTLISPPWTPIAHTLVELIVSYRFLKAPLIFSFFFPFFRVDNLSDCSSSLLIFSCASSKLLVNPSWSIFHFSIILYNPIISILLFWGREHTEDQTQDSSRQVLYSWAAAGHDVWFSLTGHFREYISIYNIPRWLLCVLVWWCSWTN